MFLENCVAKYEKKKTNYLKRTEQRCQIYNIDKQDFINKTIENVFHAFGKKYLKSTRCGRASLGE